MATKPKMMEEVPSEIADKLQTMRNNRAAENYKRAKESVVATPKTAKPAAKVVVKPKPKAKAPVKKLDPRKGYNSEGKLYPPLEGLYHNGIMFDED
jgi:hypothetical protein